MAHLAVSTRISDSGEKQKNLKRPLCMPDFHFQEQ